MPDLYELNDRQTELLGRLRAAGAPSFEYDHRSVVAMGTADPVWIGASREELRALNRHPAKLLRFDRSKAPRWVFELSTNAAEFG